MAKMALKEANMKLLIVFPPAVSKAYLGGMYDFAVLPKSKTVEIAQVFQTLLQPPPVNQNKYLIINRFFDHKEEEEVRG